MTCHGSLQEGFTEEAVVSLAKMAYNTPDHTYVLLAREANSLEFGSIVATLRFTVKEIDPSTGRGSRIPEKCGQWDEGEMGMCYLNVPVLVPVSWWNELRLDAWASGIQAEGWGLAV